MRLGIYFNLTDYVKFDRNNGQNLSAGQKAGCSLLAGSIGSFFGNPCDLILVRMQSDSMLPVEERRNYSSFFNAFRRIAAEEGVTSLWRGSVSTMLRACAMNVSMLTTYETVKETLQKSADPNDHPFKLQAKASLCSAVVTCFVSLPFDNLKTKL
jgi:solute carrier family 25 oxoglutarate transporter 11